MLAAMNRYLMQTEAERASTFGALNLFFGALLGANLGSYAELPLNAYIRVIVLITGAVAALQVALRSERRVYAWSTLACYAVLLGFSLRPSFWPGDTRPPGYDKLLVTLAAWAVAATFVRLMPVLPPASGAASARPQSSDDLDSE